MPQPPECRLPREIQEMERVYTGPEANRQGTGRARNRTGRTHSAGFCSGGLDEVQATTRPKNVGKAACLQVGHL